MSDLPRLLVVLDRSLVSPDDQPRLAGELYDAGVRAFYLRDTRTGDAVAARIIAEELPRDAWLLVTEAAAPVLDERTLIHRLDGETREGVESRWGQSVHSPECARDAAAAGASYVVFGHVYETSSKPGLDGRGLMALQTCARQCGETPLFAIGGITPELTSELVAHGAYGVAVMSGVLNAESQRDAVASYLAELPDARASGAA